MFVNCNWCKSAMKFLIICILFLSTFFEMTAFDLCNIQYSCQEEIIDSIDENSKPILISVGAETMPLWFFEFPASDSGTIYSIGISDPGIDDSTAKFQATHRALLTAGLMMGSDISGVFDDYHSESGKKYEEMNKIRNLFPLVGKYYIADSFNTRFKEKVVLLKFIKNVIDTIRINVSIDYYKSQVESYIGTKNYVSISTKYRVDTCKYLYSYEQNGNDFSIVSIANKRSYEIPLGMYQYFKTGTDEREDIIYLQHKGLWYGYYQAFIDGVALMTSTVRSRSKSLGQVENQDSQKQLAREIMNNKLIFRINKVSPIGGKLEMSMSAIK